MLNIPKKEEEILAFWKKEDIFQKSLDKKSPKGEFVFYEGPPTANGRPGLHHVIARAFKDVVCRFKTMQGYHVVRKAGWDTHGLPVEIEVEKQIGIKGKADIEKFGVEAFNKKCRESVWKYKEEWERMTERMGYWLDLEHPYITYENEYIETVWWILKQAWDKKFLYQGYKVVPHCPRCGTSLSSHELALGYKTITDISVFIQFKVTAGNAVAKAGDYILSWTTTPWTLPGNVALAVGADITYARVKKDGKHFILAKPLLNSVLEGVYEIESEFTGAKLEGVAYEPLFDVPAIKKSGKRAHYVTTADFVTIEDGTGVVHTAVMYGEDDFNLGTVKDLPFVHLLTPQGIFNDEAPQSLRKLNFKEAEEMVILELTQKGLLFGQKDYEHSYPYCWRCDNPLMYFAKTTWFIKMTALKDDLLKNAETINWYPEHLKKGRFGEWLENVKDWAVSRERYWGTPLPIWQCEKCKTFRCIGSIKELGSAPEDLHRPFIDGVTLSCECGGTMKRVPEVIDAWLDSGSMPFAQHHYPFENKKLINGGAAYPAEYISEAIDQTRGWFYTLLAVSTLLGKGASYKNVVCLGHINDAEGKKMSKSKGNVVDPWMIAEKYGMDALRYHLFTINQPGETKSFDEKNLIEVSRKVLMTLANVVSFYQLYPSGSRKAGKKSTMDRWILARLNKLVKEVTEDLEAYRILEAGRSLGDFINELSTWYVRRSRDAFKNEETRATAASTLREVLATLARLMAPFMPFLAEHVWKELGAEDCESVHLASWPTANTKHADEQLLDHMAVVRSIVEKAHALRAAAGIKVRQPLSKLEITTSLPKDLSIIVADEVNVKEVVVVEAVAAAKDVPVDEQKTTALHLSMSSELKAEGALRELIRGTNAFRKEKGLTPLQQVTASYHTTNVFLKEVIEKNMTQLSKQTSAKMWTMSNAPSGKAKKMTIEGADISVELSYGV